MYLFNLIVCFNINYGSVSIAVVQLSLIPVHLQDGHGHTFSDEKKNSIISFSCFFYVAIKRARGACAR